MLNQMHITDIKPRGRLNQPCRCSEKRLGNGAMDALEFASLAATNGSDDDIGDTAARTGGEDGVSLSATV